MVSSVKFIQSTASSNFPNRMLLDFIISHAHGDQRPYLEVSVLGYPFLGLLDSGATQTLVGSSGFQILRRLGLVVRLQTGSCVVANGQSCASTGVIQAPLCLMGKTCLVDILIVPELSQQLILGVDFWKAMGIIPDLRQNVWHFTSNVDTVQVGSAHGIFDETSLSPERREKLNCLIQRKLSLMGNDLGCCTIAEHEIEILPGTKPIKQRYYPVSPFKQKIIDDEIKNMLDQGVIESSKSSWSSPVCLVRKKDDSYRFCIDYRQLNAVTKKDAYPLPYISAILDQLRDAKYLSSIDIKSAFFQVPLSESSREFTAFTVPGRGLYQFLRMPFGLTNAPATWQRIIDTVLGADLQPFVLVYLDDIIIVSQDFDEHLRILSLVFDRLLAAGLVVSQKKCKFCLPELKYLGYVVDKYGLHPDPGKVEAILNISVPRNVSEVRRFIGTASWYRRFIPNFATILAPLTNLTKKSVKWNWSVNCEDSFKKIKECLVTAPILTCPDFTRTFILQTDSSSYGIGAVLSQEFPDGERAICFLSRSLTRQERNYSAVQREALAVIYSIEHLRHYLEGVHFKVITDCHSLLWLLRLKDPQGRLARWVLRLQPYDFELIHRKGKDHIVPDFLSRAVPVLADAIEVIPVDSPPLFSDTNDKWYKGMIVKVNTNPEKFPSWRVESDMLYKYCKCRIPELSKTSDYWKIVIPKDKRLEILKRSHNDVTSGHVGVFKTFWKIRDRYYWPKMKCDILKYVKSCRVCAEQKPEQKRPAGLMGTRPDIREPWQMISLDFIGPFPRSSRGYVHCLVVTDFYSKFVVTFPHRTATAKSLAKNIEEGIFLVYGAPQYLICDNGGPMKSKEFQNLCRRYKTKIFYTASYLPRADPTERVNRVVKTMISSYIQGNHRKWDENLAAISCAIRTARHEVTGYSPYFVNFGREHKLFGTDYLDRIPDAALDLNDEIKQRQSGYSKMFVDISKKLKTSQENSKRTYDLRRRSVQYVVGQKVWRRNKCQSDALNFFNAKLAPKFIGPFRICKKLGSWTYELEDDLGNKKGVWHVQDLKPDNTNQDDNFPV